MSNSNDLSRQMLPPMPALGRRFDLVNAIREATIAKVIDVIRLFVEEEIPEEWNPFPFLALCRYYHEENLIDIVPLLIQKNVDVNRKTNDGDNALTLLCQYYKKENLLGIIRLLIEKNIDIHCKTNEGLNALHLVCWYYRNENLIDIAKLLIEANIDVHCKDNNGWNALHSVCFNAPKLVLVDLVRLLVQNQIDKRAKTNRGKRPRDLLLWRRNNVNRDQIEDILQMLES